MRVAGILQGRLQNKWLMWMIQQKGIKPFLLLFFTQELRVFFERLKKIVAQVQTNSFNHHPRIA
uniref:hypothetical protein n=1 Tax=Algoriphagus sp. TaxID=1872435 RepID=UPI004047BA3A